MTARAAIDMHRWAERASSTIRAVDPVDLGDHLFSWAQSAAVIAFLIVVTAAVADVRRRMSNADKDVQIGSLRAYAAQVQEFNRTTAELQKRVQRDESKILQLERRYEFVPMKAVER